MAISNQNLIDDALSLLGVLFQGETSSPEQAQQALRVLNEMMADWLQSGIDLEYFDQTSLAAETPIQDQAIRAVKHSLAVALAPYYGRKVSAELAANYDAAYSRLLHDAIVDSIEPADMSDLPQGARRFRRTDISTL